MVKVKPCVKVITIEPSADALSMEARCFVSKMVRNGNKSVFAYLSPKWASLTNVF